MNDASHDHPYDHPYDYPHYETGDPIADKTTAPDGPIADRWDTRRFTAQAGQPPPTAASTP